MGDRAYGHPRVRRRPRLEYGALTAYSCAGTRRYPTEMFAQRRGYPRVIEARQAEVEGTEADHRARSRDRASLRHRWEWRSVPYFSKRRGVHAATRT